MTSIKQLTRLIQLAQGEWPKSQWGEMGILAAEEELRAINAALLAGEHIAKMCGALRDERDALRVELVAKVEQTRAYFQKLDMLAHHQGRMRDPERTLVCDILANGQLLPDPDGSRYGVPTTTDGKEHDETLKSAQ